MFQAKLSNVQRAEKKLRLYDHITSDLFRRKLADTGKLTQQLLDLDVEEVKDPAARLPDPVVLLDFLDVEIVGFAGGVARQRRRLQMRT
jgi:hypothetical protein